MNAGRELGQLSACFVLPVGDSMDSIFEAIKNTALIHKSGGGTGFSFSRVRPKNDVVMSTKGVASGPAVLHERLRRRHRDHQAGRHPARRQHGHPARRPPRHPRLHHRQARRRPPQQLQHLGGRHRRLHAAPSKPTSEYPLVNPRSGETVTHAQGAQGLQLAWSRWPGRTATPASSSSTASTSDNPTPAARRDREPPTPAASSRCCPTSRATWAPSTWRTGRATTASVDYGRLGRIVKTAVRFLDDVIDVNNYPAAADRRDDPRQPQDRPGGHGLCRPAVPARHPLRLRRGRAAGRRSSWTSSTTEARAASVELADERGVFPNFEGSIFDGDGGPRLRNATVTTIAPTGTICIIAGCSSGIEPLFALSYVRRKVLDDDEMLEVYPYFEEVARREGFYSEALMQRIADEGSVAPRRRRARALARRVRHRPRRHARVARQAAGGLPGAHRQRRLQDGQLPQPGHRRRRREGLPARLSARAARASPSTATAAARSRS